MLPSKHIQSLSNPVQSNQEEVAAEILGSFSKYSNRTRITGTTGTARCHNDNEFRMIIMPQEQGLLPPRVGFSGTVDAEDTFKSLGIGSIPNRAAPESDTQHLSSFNSQHREKILLSPGQQQGKQNEFVDESGYIINSSTKSILSQSVKLMNKKFPVKVREVTKHIYH